MNARAVKWGVGVYAMGRIALSLWAILIVQLNPLTVTNLNLYGTPVVAVFNQRTSARAVFSPQVDGQLLLFRAAAPNFSDVETGTVWDVSGQSISGPLAGRSLSSSPYTVEDVFPYRGIAASNNPLLAPWQRFDTNWYLKIAERGYSADDGSTVYFPLYPLLIRLVSIIFPSHTLAAAFLVSNLALVGVFSLLFEMAEEVAGSAVAARTLAFVAIFPTAFFLFAAYTESLFLLFAIASLRMASRRHWVLAGLFGTLAAFTRLQGFALVLPLAYTWWKEWKSAGAKEQDLATVGSKANRLPQASGLALFLIPLASGGFLLWQDYIVGAAPILTTFEGRWHARFVMPWDQLGAAILLIIGRPSLVDILNLAATLVFAILIFLLLTRRQIAFELAVYAGALFLIPLFRMTTEQPFVSMTRYVLVLFPVFILLGKWGASAWAQRAIAYASFPLALYLSAQFILWGWVG